MDLHEQIILGLFIGLVGYFLINGLKKNKKPKNIDDLIKNDHTLQKLDEEIGALNAKYSKELKGDKRFMAIAKKHGIEIDGDTEFQFDKNLFHDQIKELLIEDDTHDEIQNCIMNLPEKVSKIELENLLSLCDEWRDILINNSEINFSEMTKDRLIEYANNEFDLKLSKSLKKDDLIIEIKKKYSSIPKKSKKEVQNDINKVKTEIYNSLIKTLKNF